MSYLVKLSSRRWLVKVFYFSLILLFVFCIHYYMTETGYYYSFTNSREDTLYVNNLTTLPPSNHNILHVLIVTYPRSGSSFVGKLLQSPSQAFYHFEPLHYLFDRTRTKTKKRGRSIRTAMKRPTLQAFLHDIFLCKYSDRFMRWASMRPNLKILERNERYWSSCNGTKLCYNTDYFHRTCRNYTMQVSKTIRMNIQDVSLLMEQFQDLNLRIIHLLRDPRGTINSRSKPAIAAWCRKDITCYSSRVFCSQLDSDMIAAQHLQEKYSEMYLPLRYEELCCDMYHQTEQIFKFLGFGEVPEETIQFLNSHNLAILQNTTSITEKYLEPSYTTVRDSLKTAFAWRRELKFSNVNVIQRHCEKVMEKMNYAIVHNEQEMHNFTFRTIINTSACDMS